jgi:hypothetical protein
MDVDGAKFLAWKAIRDIFDGSAEAGPGISLALWWSCEAAAAAAPSRFTPSAAMVSPPNTTSISTTCAPRGCRWCSVIRNSCWRKPDGACYAGEAVPCPIAARFRSTSTWATRPAPSAARSREFFASNVTEEQRARFHYSWEGYVPEVHQAACRRTRCCSPACPRNCLAAASAPMPGSRPWASSSARDTRRLSPTSRQMVAMMIHKFGSDELKREVLSKDHRWPGDLQPRLFGAGIADRTSSRPSARLRRKPTAPGGSTAPRCSPAARTCRATC